METQKTATARDYKRSCGHGHYDHMTLWTCPICGQKNSMDCEEDWATFEGDVGHPECVHCGQEIQVTFRRFSGRKF